MMDAALRPLKILVAAGLPLALLCSGA